MSSVSVDGLNKNTNFSMDSDGEMVEKSNEYVTQSSEAIVVIESIDNSVSLASCMLIKNFCGALGSNKSILADM